MIGNSIDGAIVESILGNAPTAEETDPQTRCQSKCGKNEVCQISGGGREITCKCRPGFGKARPGSSCESKKICSICTVKSALRFRGFVKQKLKQ